MRVYIVTKKSQYCPYDHRIVGVYSSKELAYEAAGSPTAGWHWTEVTLDEMPIEWDAGVLVD